MMPGELANANGADANVSDADGANAKTYSWVIRGAPSSVITLSASSCSESSAIISEDGAGVMGTSDDQDS